MNIAIINGTNRINNKTVLISKTVEILIKKLGHTTHLLTLDYFDSLFRGKYIDYASANKNQKKDIRKLIEAKLIFFVIPTYHSGIPSPLKNFLDILKCNECYDEKVIALIAGSDHNQDLGARQTMQVINGILSYQKAKSFVIPRINIVNFNVSDATRLFDFIKYSVSFAKKYEQPHQSDLGHGRCDVDFCSI
ncbi:hypothetical protein A2866_05915 [Candidatus Roizmanbacteria bacterium RIFCSPHIGHO2_01_FULL_39_8]|uniref:NADPH-dependent FMN reductase-like domain-containing protein n=3 Tax=Candidatus Roizmaniibacteriota TaxID=1752723 RepID=A0A1F7GFK1_9BACT|nr:MAG: hypothetical protein A2866_05915 [Candidatus Roizmanbacteria bacterium RIFCSPHIGHO2_01_FULL_39_8]OGK26692.1 MAG: hypothetical protein A3C28_00305 [Candidatus Roizmanbacteria bacterium RIFCSPHIGHO2_02_FULL_39_9]OGK36889.1 MAG: hypothetical protein A3F60_04595 [Candidatus Roizmanbacteria bacterium RIFCSPHIGHO2_12_FULL_39_8]